MPPGISRKECILFLLTVLVTANSLSLFKEYTGDTDDKTLEMFNLCDDNTQIDTDCNTVVEVNWAALKSSAVLYDQDSQLRGRNPEKLDRVFEENNPNSGIRSAVFTNGTDGTTAYFTFNSTHVVGSVHRPDGITERIVSIDADKQLR